MSYSSDEDNVALAKRRTTRPSNVSYLESSDDDDIPLAKAAKLSPNVSDTSLSSESDVKKKPKKAIKKRVKAEDSDFEEDAPVPAKKKKTANGTNGTAKTKSTSSKKTATKKATATNTKTKDEKKTKAVKKEEEKDDKTKLKKASTPKKTASAKKTKAKNDDDDDDAKAKTKEEEEEEEEAYKWWEQQDFNDEIKWTTLEHNGVMFPPPYKPLPKKVKLLYDGQPVDLPVEAEEVAGFFGALVETDHGKNPTFQKNFFNDFLTILQKAGGTQNGIQIKEFSKCDFTKIYDYFEKEKEKKKSLSKDEKKAAKEKKEAEEAPFKFCTMDGRKEQVGNFRVEPPGLFRGRGSHPKTGSVKNRVRPEDITINIGKEAKIPSPPRGHKWAEVKHDNTGAWLAMWKENVLGNTKYVRLAANSSIKGISDFKKFEKARELKNHIGAIRKDYKLNLRSKLMQERQMATATYLIDIFALRAGGEKGEDEADTVGCCSLRYEHVTLQPPRTVIFDFLGKDSIRFYQEVEVDLQVFKNLKIFKKAPKGVGDQLFDRIDPSILNAHFRGYMQGLTAKVFRTYNASKTMQDLLRKIPNEGTANEKLVKFNAANREVAILCNHQRSVTKGHAASVAKITERLKEMVWQKIRFKRMMVKIDSKLKKKDPDYFKDLDELTEEEESTAIEVFIEKEKDKITKKFNKENEKIKSENGEIMKKAVLHERIKEADKLKKVYLKEAKTKKANQEEIDSKKYDIAKLEKLVEKIEERIANTTLQLKDKEENATVSLGTSKINYIDPRLLVMFSKKFNVPIEKLFTKTLREKFKWAIESADENWEF